VINRRLLTTITGSILVLVFVFVVTLFFDDIKFDGV
jgi:uncharacterized membrane protein